MMMMKHLVILGLLAGGCGHRGDAAEPATTDPAGGSSQPKFETVAVIASPAHWTDDVPARIIFDETHTSRVGAPLGGRVSSVMVQLGQRVKAGAELVSVTSGDLADFYGARDKAKNDLDAAEVSYKRIKELVELGSLPKKELEGAEQDLREATVNYNTANQKIASLKVGTGGATQFTIVAPREGVVVEKNVAVGQQISPDSGSILAIADLSDVWVVADLLEDAIDDIKAGTKAQVTIDASPTPLDGVVGQVAQVVDPERHTVPVRVKLQNATGILRPNALAQIRFYEDGKTGSMSVPADAILSDGATAYVYVVVNGVPARREVVVGGRNAKTIEIKSGLALGDQVVARGAGLLDNQLPAELANRIPK